MREKVGDNSLNRNQKEKIFINERVMKLIKRILNIVSIIGVLVSIVGVIYLWRIGVFTDEKVLKDMIKGHSFGAIIFTVIQIIQVVIPIIPGGITLAVGVLIFGPFLGFIYNYIGIVIGSIILFYIGRTYGQNIAKALVKEKIYDKYMTAAKKHQRKFNLTFLFVLLFPLAPDDALVLIASQTKMTWRFFFISIFLCKIPSIFVYSYLLIYGGGWLLRLFMIK